MLQRDPPIDVAEPMKPRPQLSPIELEPRGIPAERPELAPIEELDEAEGNPETRPLLSSLEKPDDVDGDPKTRPVLRALDAEPRREPRARPVLPRLP